MNRQAPTAVVADFHERMHATHMYGLWELASQMTRHPEPKAISYLWKASVIEAMVRGLGARIIEIEAPFDPEGGAYASSHAHASEAHAHAHAQSSHAHAHAHSSHDHDHGHHDHSDHHHHDEHCDHDHHHHDHSHAHDHK